MKKWLLASMLLLSGCAQLTSYNQVVKTPDPSLVGVWKTVGPQKALRSPQARATLIISKDGDTFDCRQWQRTIGKPGKLANIDNQQVVVNRLLRIQPLTLHGQKIHYDGLELNRVDAVDSDCAAYLQYSQNHPSLDVVQSIVY